MRPLFEDMCACEDLFSSQNSQFARRTFVRSVFAFHEAHFYTFKNTAIEWLIKDSWQNRKIEVSKLALLKDVEYRPDKTGVLKESASRLPFLNQIALVLRTLAESAGVDPTTIFSDNGWSSMQTALSVRHRITHPKVPTELEINDEEMDAARDSVRWAFASTQRVVQGKLVKHGIMPKGDS